MILQEKNTDANKKITEKVWKTIKLNFDDTLRKEKSSVPKSTSFFSNRNDEMEVPELPPSSKDDEDQDIFLHESNDGNHHQLEQENDNKQITSSSGEINSDNGDLSGFVNALAAIIRCDGN